jgi:putative ABC transport system permease protein
MNLSTFVLRNLFRRKFRSVLTLTAIAVAIGAVVALVGVANGLEDSFLQLYKGRDIDLVVVRSGGKQRLNSSLESKPFRGSAMFSPV